MKNPSALSLVLALIASAAAAAADLYVSPTGGDNHSTLAGRVFRSLSAAQSAARRHAGKEPVTIHLAPGVYYLPTPLVFTPSDSGAERAPVVYQGEAGGEVVISGGARLQLDWKPYRNGIFQAETPPGLEIDQLWINGQRQWMARFPNREPGEGFNVFDAWRLDGDARADPARDPLLPARIARWANPAGGFLHALHPALWGGVHWRITGKKPDGSLALEGGTQNNRGSGIHPLFRMVENIFEELDAHGEWFHDPGARRLYFYPPPATDLKTAVVETVRLRHLIEYRGDQTHPVRFLSLRGLTFRHAARTFMETKEPLLRSDWTTYRGGALVLSGAEDCAVDDCAFDQVGGNAIFVSGYNRRIRVRRCRIENSGANGIAFVGDVRAVRSPLLNYDAASDYATIDRTPGPATSDYPSDCLVEDCLIARTGRVEKQTAGVEIAMSKRITIRHCSIYEAPRAGINIGDGCWGGHVIEFCDVFDTVLETGDHGSFNSWGRDRFWSPDTQVMNREVAADPTLPFLDVTAPITLRNNRWRCDHGWDVDLDDGSSHYRIYNNLFLNGGLKLREGYDRRVWNNIAINNSLHPHVWLKNSGDIATNNVWMGAYRPAVMPGDSQKWGKQLDFNLFATSEKDRRHFLGNDCDRHSITADPQFRDPARGDFRVASTSPALRLGFTNFPMDQFGVQDPKLKKLAKTPQIPAVHLQVNLTPPQSAAETLYVWGGATLKPLSNDEFSGYGVARTDGGLAVLFAPDASPASQVGWRAGDVIQQINGSPTRTFTDLERWWSETRDRSKPATVRIVRNQNARSLAFHVFDDPPTIAPDGRR